jgi:non-heme chloroperoxidase
MMSTISNGPVTLHVEDSGGDGRPVVLVHGWPLSGASWSGQVPALTEAGYRVVRYDRRGFGESDKPGDTSGYDYDTLTGDLDAVLTGLDLRDVTLVGFSMGGGEVARYLGTHGDDRVHSAVFAAAIPPCLKLDDDHPDGALDDDTVAGYQGALEADPPGFLEGFTRNFFSAGDELKVSEAQVQEALGLGLQADVHAARECIRSWTTDFTGDLAKVTVPTLVIHGDSDGIVPFEKSGQRTHEQVAGSELHVVEGGPHGINTSHAQEFNRELLAFLER